MPAQGHRASRRCRHRTALDRRGARRHGNGNHFERGVYADFLPDWRSRHPNLAGRDELARLAPPEAFILCAGTDETVEALVARREADPLVGGTIGAIAAVARQVNATSTPEDLLDYGEHVREHGADADPPREYFGPEEDYAFYQEALAGEIKGVPDAPPLELEPADGALTPPEKFLALLEDAETTDALLARHTADPFAGQWLHNVLARVSAVGSEVDLTDMGESDEDRLAVDFHLYEVPFPSHGFMRDAGDGLIDAAQNSFPQMEMTPQLEQSLRDHGPRLKSALILTPDERAVEYDIRLPPLLVEEHSKKEIESRLRATLDDREFGCDAEVRVFRQYDEGLPVPDPAAAALGPLEEATGLNLYEPPAEGEGPTQEDFRERWGLPDVFSPHIEGIGVSVPVADVLDMMEWFMGAAERTWGVSHDNNPYLTEGAGSDRGPDADTTTDTEVR